MRESFFSGELARGLCSHQIMRSEYHHYSRKFQLPTRLLQLSLHHCTAAVLPPNTNCMGPARASLPQHCASLISYNTTASPDTLAGARNYSSRCVMTRINDSLVTANAGEGRGCWIV